MELVAVCVLILAYSQLVCPGQTEGGALTVFKLTVNATCIKVRIFTSQIIPPDQVVVKHNNTFYDVIVRSHCHLVIV